MQGKWAVAVVAMLAAGTSSSEAGVRVGLHLGHRVALARHLVVRAPVLRVSTGPRVVMARGFGELRVEVEPDRARVFIDGRDQGKGDKARTLRSGTHHVKVALADGREASQTVHVSSGHRTIVRLELN